MAVTMHSDNAEAAEESSGFELSFTEGATQGEGQGEAQQEAQGNLSQQEARGKPLEKQRISPLQKQQILELRKAGMSTLQISEALGLPVWKVQHHLRKMLRGMKAEAAQDIVQLELQRLDSLYSVCYRQAMQGSLAAVDRCIAISTRRASYLGLDKQQAVAHSTNVGVLVVGGGSEEYIAALRSVVERPLGEIGAGDEELVIEEEDDE